jgi:hypothetical protein
VTPRRDASTRRLGVGEIDFATAVASMFDFATAVASTFDFATAVASICKQSSKCLTFEQSNIRIIESKYRSIDRVRSIDFDRSIVRSIDFEIDRDPTDRASTRRVTKRIVRRSR